MEPCSDPIEPFNGNPVEPFQGNLTEFCKGNPNFGAWIITSTILGGAPYYHYSIVGPKTLF